MYGSTGSISGIVHFVARRPLIAATIAAAVVVGVAKVPAPPAPPNSPVIVAVAPTPTTPTPTPTDSSTVESTPASSKSTVIGQCQFKVNSARVDNTCKAQLDDAALALRQAPNASLVLIGSPHRVENVKAYLTNGEGGAGINPDRIGSRITTSTKVVLYLTPEF